jgi:hypothetical protein
MQKGTFTYKRTNKLDSLEDTYKVVKCYELMENAVLEQKHDPFTG